MKFLKIMLKLLSFCRELQRGFRVLRGIKHAVTILGSARLPEDHPACLDAMAVSQGLAESENEYAIISGGGEFGIMRAANKGASIGGTPSVGCSIEILHEHRTNSFVDTDREAKFKRFFLRKFIMFRATEAIIAFPGGYGTLDELFEALTLIQCQKQETPVKVILYDSNFWGGLVAWIKQTMYFKYKTISGEDLFLFSVVDTPEEAISIVCGTELPAVATATLQAA